MLLMAIELVDAIFAQGIFADDGLTKLNQDQKINIDLILMSSFCNIGYRI